MKNEYRLFNCDWNYHTISTTGYFPDKRNQKNYTK